MRRSVLQGGFAVLTTLLALSGCGGGAPSVSGSSTEATVHGVVKYKGQPVTEGEIRFDPANISRKDAKAVSAQIGKDGTYTLKTLTGENNVYFNVPELLKKDPSLATAMSTFSVSSGDNTFDIDVSNPRP